MKRAYFTILLLYSYKKHVNTLDLCNYTVKYFYVIEFNKVHTKGKKIYSGYTYINIDINSLLAKASIG